VHGIAIHPEGSRRVLIAGPRVRKITLIEKDIPPGAISPANENGAMVIDLPRSERAIVELRMSVPGSFDSGRNRFRSG
jgi:hypothetical protein